MPQHEVLDAQAARYDRLAWEARDLARQIQGLQADDLAARREPGEVYSDRRLLLASAECAIARQAPNEWARSERLGVLYGRAPKMTNGAFVPRVLSRALTVAGDGAGLVAVAQSYRAEAQRGGASFLPLCTSVPAAQLGNLNVGRVDDPPTAYVLDGEADPITESSPTAARYVAAPRAVGAYLEASRLLLTQGGETAAQGLVASLAVAVRNKAQDLIATGSGANGEPLGLLNDSAVTVESGTTVAYSTFCAVAETVEANAGDGPLFWVLSSGAAEIARQRLVGTGSTPILGESMTIAGHPVIVVAGSASYAILGFWRDLLLIEWAPLEVAANPFANFQAAIAGLRARLDFDCVPMRPKSFAAISAIT